MGKHGEKFRPYDPNQVLLLPPVLQEWLPANHLVYFLSDVADQLDLTDIEKSYEVELRGQPPYHPHMMVKLLLYSYCTGVYSSRRIAQRIEEDIAFRVLAAGNQPDFRTISDFRRRHLEPLKGLFGQVLGLCRNAGLVKLGHVALDGTKIKANASKHKAMSYGRMKQEEGRLQRDIEAIEEMMRRAETADQAEDQQYGSRRGDELPAELAHRQQRLARIRAAKQALEAEAAAKAQASEQQHEDDDSKGEPPSGGGHMASPATPPKRRGRKPKPKSAIPDDKAQRNFTDPESRILFGSGKTVLQGYNAQAAVDAQHQIIVAQDLTNHSSDRPHLRPMVQAVEQNMGQRPREVSADAGYFSADHLEWLREQGIEAFIPPDKQRHGQRAESPRGRMPRNMRPIDRMRRKLLTKRGRERYSLRKETVEPVFGQIKQARGFRQFLLRGLEKVRAEWSLLCTAHNLLKLWKAERGKPALA